MPTSFSYQYDPRSRRYRNAATGQYVPASDVRQAVDAVIDAETAKIRGISQSLIDGKINLAEWQLQTTALLKSLHVAMGLAANGGLKQTSPSDLGYIGSLLKEQYAYLRQMTVDIKTGKQPLDGTLLARSALYCQAARSTYQDVLGRVAGIGGCTEEKSEIGMADHCDLCLQEASKGWQPIGTLIPIGERTCRQNCRCSMSYR